jgi:hypothetical protein
LVCCTCLCNPGDANTAVRRLLRRVRNCGRTSMTNDDRLATNRLRSDSSLDELLDDSTREQRKHESGNVDIEAEDGRDAQIDWRSSDDNLMVIYQVIKCVSQIITSNLCIVQTR